MPARYRKEHNQILKKFARPLEPGGLPLGERVEWHPFAVGAPRHLSLPEKMRADNPHVLLVGQRGMGKSRLLASMIAHDIEAAQRAVVVIDSDGGLAQLIWSWAASHEDAEEICSRITILDPTKKDCLVAFNPLARPTDDDLQGAATAVVSGFKSIYQEAPGTQNQWSEQTAGILLSSTILLMATGRNLADLPILLSDNDFRDVLLQEVEKQKSRPEISTMLEAWHGRYKRLARTDEWIRWTEPILNRIQPVLSEPSVRAILTGQENLLNLENLIRRRKVLLVRLPQARLEQTGHLLGSLIVAGLKQAALSLWSESADEDNPCALYVDEFSNFIEKDFFARLTGDSDKLQISLTGATATFQGLSEEYRNTIITNVGNLGAFALTKKDADYLASQMFRIDGNKRKHTTVSQWFSAPNATPTFELSQDEVSLNVDRIVGQDDRMYFLYRSGTKAGVFHLKAPTFNDIEKDQIRADLVKRMLAPKAASKKKSSK